jgi:inner membrane protein
MSETPTPSLVTLVIQFFKRLSTTAKVGGIALLALLLLIPLSFVEDLMRERMERRNGAVTEITATWGDSQEVLGPILMVPFKYYYTEKKWVVENNKSVARDIEVSQTDLAFFLPDKLQVEGSVAPRKLYKGIYQAVVYDADLHVKGEFTAPDFAPFKIDKYEVDWEQATLGFPIRDLRGVRDTLKVNWNGRELVLQPGSGVKFYPKGAHVDVPKLPQSGKIPFSLDIALRGSGSIQFAPTGMENEVSLNSAWPDPGFRGAFLPQERRITPQGFDANWKVSYYGRNFPQQWRGSDSGYAEKELASSYYGVEFVSLIDSYRNVERATKYGLLFIALVFVTFFLFETLTGLKVHAIQYTLVGAALVLFYLALLSLSEFVNFGLSYIVAGAASTLLISLYSTTVLKSGKLAGALAAGLAVVYGLLYFILQLQDYSLLAGTAGLLIALAAVMYVTRNIDWYGRGAGEKEI